MRHQSKDQRPQSKDFHLNILITSGGTKVPLDEVRHLGNMSSGRFGADIAKAALRAGHKVTFLCAKGSVRPDEVTLNLGHGNCLRTLSAMLTDGDLIWGFRNLLTVDQFANFDEYAAKLQQHLEQDKPDVTMLAAAVSDYGGVPVVGKIPSDQDSMTLTLTRLPKLITRVKEWCPTTFLVGFKLLAGATATDRREAATKQLTGAKSDLVVANDLHDIKRGEHILYVYPHPDTVEVIKTDLAPKLVALVQARRQA